MSKLLLVEDEKVLCSEIKEWLQHEQYVVETLHDGITADQTLAYDIFDVIILDWMLPGMSGLDLCKSLRARGTKTPILMLTARSSLESKELGLDSGADDYLTKPFQLKELSARVRSLLRRETVAPALRLQVKDIVLDSKARTVSKSGTEIHLEPREFNLLEFLFRHPNIAFGPEALIQRVWESSSSTSTETLRSYIKSIRKKIDTPNEESIITTVHGSGYKVARS